ncbi:MAG: hypothetical protein CMM44_07605 [Rhodospirillaceae bacterium]|nr:hypothetical protein [Rhodospirillaceae bacterium]
MFFKQKKIAELNRPKQSLVDIETLLFEAEDKNSLSFIGKSKFSSINWARRFCADMLYAHSRHFLKVNFVQEISYSHAKSTQTDIKDLPFNEHFEAPQPFTDNIKTAQALLGAAVVLYPKHGSAWLNLGVSYIREKNWEKAREALEISKLSGGIVAGYSYWFLADAQWNLGEKTEAIITYKKAMGVAPSIRGIMASTAAERCRETGDVECATIIYSEALKYQHTHVPEFIHQPITNSHVPELERINPQNGELQNFDTSNMSKFLGCNCSIWKIRGQYYCIPNQLGIPAGVTITTSGLSKSGFKKMLEEFLVSNNIISRICLLVFGKIFRGMVIRGLRRKIRSAKNIIEFENPNHEMLKGLINPTQDGLYDKLGLFYVVYRGNNGDFFAIPIRMEPFSPEELLPSALSQSSESWRFHLGNLLNTFPSLYRYGYPVLKIVLPGVKRRFERSRIRDAESFDSLVKKVHEL